MLPTIRIKAAVSEDNPLGYIVINEADFDASVHEALDPVEDSTDLAEPSPQASGEAQAAPARRGRKAKAE